MSSNEAEQDPAAAAAAAFAGTDATVEAAVAPKKTVKRKKKTRFKIVENLSGDGGGGGDGGGDGGGGAAAEKPAVKSFLLKRKKKFAFLDGVCTLENLKVAIPYSSPNSVGAERLWAVAEDKTEEDTGLYYYRKATGITKKGELKGAKEDMGRLVETWIRVCIFHEIKQILKKSNIKAYVIEGSPTAVHDIDVNHFFMPESGDGGGGGGGGGGGNDTGGGDEDVMQKNILMKDILVKLIGHGISVKAFGGGSWPLGDLARQFDNARDKFIFVIVEYESQTKNKFSNVTALNICVSDPDGKNLFNLKGEQLKKMQDDFFLKQRWGGFLLKRLRVKKTWVEANPKWKFSKAVTEKYKGKKLVEFARSCPASREEKLLWKIKNYTSSDDLAKQYLIKAGNANDGESYFKHTIAANQIYKMVLYWIVYYGNLITIREITNKKPQKNKMIIFKSFFNHAGGHSEQEIIQVLRQCEFAPPNPDLFVDSTLYKDFSVHVARLWAHQASESIKKLPSWLEELDFQPDGNIENAKRPGSIWANEGVFIKKTGVNVASKWNTTSTVRFPQFGMSERKFHKTMGQSVNRFSDNNESALFQILKNSCRFQLVTRTKFAKYEKSMEERDADIKKREKNLKHGIQGGDKQRDYKQFIMQTGGGGKAEGLAAEADFAEVALLEEEQAQQRIRDIEEDEQIAKADAEIIDIKNREVQKILDAESLLLGLAAEDAVERKATLATDLGAAVADAARDRAAATEEAAAEKDRATANVKQVEGEIEDKIKDLNSSSSAEEKEEVVIEFTGRLDAAKKELDIKVEEALRLRCEEMKEQPAPERSRRARAASTASANVTEQAFEQYENICGKALGNYRDGGVDFIIKLGARIDAHEAGDKSRKGHIPGKFDPNLQLWEIFKENKLIIKKIELNHVVASLGEFAPDDDGGGGGAGAAAPKKPGLLARARAAYRKFRGKKGEKGGRRTRRKKKKRKKRTRRK